MIPIITVTLAVQGVGLLLCFLSLLKLDQQRRRDNMLLEKTVARLNALRETMRDVLVEFEKHINYHRDNLKKELEQHERNN